MRHQIIQHNKFCLNKYFLTEEEATRRRGNMKTL